MKKITAILLCLAMIFSLSACGRKDNPEEENSNPYEIGSNGKTVDYDDVKPDLGLMKVSYPTDDTMEEVFELRQKEDAGYISSINDFSGRLASELLTDTKDNAMISPISIQMAMTLAGIGAGGETKEEIFDALGLSGMETADIAKQNAILYRLLYKDTDFGGLKIANSLWIKKDMGFEKDYINRAASDFYASIHPVDFGNPDTGKLIGKWISENTGKLLEPQITTDPSEVISIINTIYYLDQWSLEFDEQRTAPDSFTTADKDKVKCDFMNMTLENYDYIKGDGFISLQLPLKNSGEMRFILPDKGVSFEELLAEPEKLTEVFNQQEGERAKIELKLPKFSFDSSFDLADTLKKMGIQSAFTSEADFSGITKDSAAFISNILHQTHIGINEKGVEAAAFTEIVLCGSAMQQSDKTVKFTLDRPFLFEITDGNVVLFIGVINNPNSKQ